MSVVKMSAVDVILVGVHGSGKTTLGRQLAEALAVPFHEELGREAMERRPERATVDAGEDFDADLWTLERARDLQARRLQGVRGVRRVVETWHIGNAAYAIQRPGTSGGRRDWRGELVARLAGHDAPIVVQPLRVDRLTFERRYSEHQGDREEAQRAFLWGVGERLGALVDGLKTCGRGITILPVIDTGIRSIGEACEALRAALGRWVRP